MVEQPVNNYARNGDVNPKRKGNAGYLAVANKVLSKCPVESNRNQGNNCNGEDRVTSQDCEIERSGEALAGEPRRAVEIVICQIRREKQRRDDKCRYLTSPMRSNATGTNR